MVLLTSRILTRQSIAEDLKRFQSSFPLLGVSQSGSRLTEPQNKLNRSLFAIVLLSENNEAVF